MVSRFRTRHFLATGASSVARLVVSTALLLTTTLLVPSTPPATAAFSGTALWPQQAKLVPNDAGEDDNAGFAVALDGDTAVIGAPYHNNVGAVYVFVRNGTTWTQQAKLTASDAASNDAFGIAVAISGDTVVVGATGDDDNGFSSGSAYVFVRSGTTWSQQAKLTANDGAESDYFGRAVAIDGDTILIGATDDTHSSTSRAGSAYVFVRNGTAWSQQAKLTASDAGAFDRFGYAVALDGDTALVGAHQDNDDGADSGSAYVFVRSGTTWSQQAKLTASDAAMNDYFGHAVALAGDTALIGAYRADNGGTDRGAAYVFVRNGTTWSEQAKLTPATAADDDQFGAAVALSGTTALVGGNHPNGHGKVAVFTTDGAAWSETATLMPNDGASNDQFGFATALSGDTALIGAYWHDATSSDSGAAYIFQQGTQEPAFLTYLPLVMK